jgi:hypothetical protein
MRHRRTPSVQRRQSYCFGPISILMEAILSPAHGGPLGGPLRVPGSSSPNCCVHRSAERPCECSACTSMFAARSTTKSDPVRMAKRIPHTAIPPAITDHVRLLQPTGSRADVIRTVMFTISGVAPYSRMSISPGPNGLRTADKAFTCCGSSELGAIRASSAPASRCYRRVSSG